MTRAQLVDKIKRKLGYPTVKVELTSAALDDCVSDALSDARKYGFGTFLHKRFYVFNLSAGVQTYTLPTSVSAISDYYISGDDPYGGGPQILFSAQNAFYFGCGFMPDRHVDLIGYHLLLQYMDTLKNYTSRTFRLHFDQMERRVYCQPTPSAIGTQPEGDGDTVVLTLWVIGSEEKTYDDVNFQKLALGYAKQVLAKIRGKYPNYQLPGGTTLNADDLRQEGIDEVEAALTQIKEESEGLELWAG